MSTRHFLIGIILLSILPVAFGQNKKAPVSSTYDRSSLSVVLIDHPEIPYSSKLKDGIAKIVIPDKYFENKISTPSVTAPYAAGFIGPVNNSIADALNTAKTGNQIISYWYARQADGTMSADRFLERGMYNASDADVLNAKGTKRGVEALKDYGDKLISKSFAVAIDYTNLKLIDDSVTRGWSADVKIFLYKIIFDETIQSQLYNDLWIYSDDTPAVKAKKNADFTKMNFNLEYVSQASASVVQTESKKNKSTTSPPKTNDELFAALMQNGLNDCIYNVEKKVEDLKVKTSIYQTNPLRAKIGKKEGLAVDNRYFVYEYVYDENTNSTKPVRRSVIRAKKVVDNRNVATGSSQMSTFYQVAGGHLENGFLLQQSNDAGIGITLGVESGSVAGFSSRLEVNVGRYTSIPSLYVFVGLGYEEKLYTKIEKTPLIDQNLNFLRYELGLAKGFRMINILELAPYAGVGFEEAKNADWKDDAQFKGNLIKSLYVKYGANLALNVRYNIQLIGGLGSYIFTTAQNGEGDIMDGDVKAKYNDYFPDRGAGSFSFCAGLRVQF